MELTEGIIFSLEKIVEMKDLASQYGSGLIDVFATPAMVGFMERTANESIMSLLPNGHITVGTEINVKHLKATPVGKKVSCKSVLKVIEGRKLKFQIEVWDESGIIGEASHTRFIVNKIEFLSKIK